MSPSFLSYLCRVFYHSSQGERMPGYHSSGKKTEIRTKPEMGTLPYPDFKKAPSITPYVCPALCIADCHIVSFIHALICNITGSPQERHQVMKQKCQSDTKTSQGLLKRFGRGIYKKMFGEWRIRTLVNFVPGTQKLLWSWPLS